MRINIHKLSIGLHELEFEETPEDLNLELKGMFPFPISSRIVLDKTETHIFLKASVGCIAHFSCDRCLQEFDMELHGDLQLYYDMSSKGSSSGSLHPVAGLDDDSIRVLRQGENEIDLSPDIRETVLLSVPMKLLCSSDCKGICPGCGRDLNQEECVCGAKPIDPRWATLQALLEKEKKDQKIK